MKRQRSIVWILPMAASGYSSSDGDKLEISDGGQMVTVGASSSHLSSNAKPHWAMLEWVGNSVFTKGPSEAVWSRRRSNKGSAGGDKDGFVPGDSCVRQQSHTLKR